ncbi:hypothetical protein C8034_v011254 [Colletotrichum sidae]|uniref:Uncharacterized protein n=1 Tax=Colletotrichum sidae TaxID=1347389 RepID=A0A4R8TCK3_9PEZI|nr:hypothetical protein C8034_v011254 [Colletotrichum sidae]
MARRSGGRNWRDESDKVSVSWGSWRVEVQRWCLVYAAKTAEIAQAAQSRPVSPSPAQSCPVFAQAVGKLGDEAANRQVWLAGWSEAKQSCSDRGLRRRIVLVAMRVLRVPPVSVCVRSIRMGTIYPYPSTL